MAITVGVPTLKRRVHVHAHAALPAAVRTAPVVKDATVAPAANALTVEQLPVPPLRVLVAILVVAQEQSASVDHLASVRAVDLLSRVRVAILVSVERTCKC